MAGRHGVGAGGWLIVFLPNLETQGEQQGGGAKSCPSDVLPPARLFFPSKSSITDVGFSSVCCEYHW